MDEHDVKLIEEAKKLPWDLIDSTKAHSEEAREILEWMEYMAWRKRRD